MIFFRMSRLAEVSRLIESAERYLRECFRSESPPRAGELATRLGLSPVQLTRAFTQGVGMRPAHYLKARQLEFAQRLLKYTRLTTNEVAYRAGFGTRATFFRLFREHARATPRRFAARPRS
jgi:AraC-like DNA-binding protein